MIKKVLKDLATAPENVTGEDVAGAIDYFLHKTPADEETLMQMGAFLGLLRGTGIDRTRADVLAAVARLVHLKKNELGESDANGKFGPTADIVGTGGDGKNTYNVSTTAAFVAAGSGVHVIKHGNIAASSTSGSADLLTALGVNLRVSPEECRRITSESPFTFLFAPVFHPSFGAFRAVRSALGIPTIFNLLGPLLHPKRPDVSLIGVSHVELGPVYAETLRLLGHTQSWVVCGVEGLDELSIAGESKIWKVAPGGISEITVAPEDFGLARHPLDAVRSGTPAENLAIFERLVAGKLPHDDAIENIVMLNASALLVAAGVCADFKSGVVHARERAASGAVVAAVDAYKRAAS